MWISVVTPGGTEVVSCEVEVGCTVQDLKEIVMRRLNASARSGRVRLLHGSFELTAGPPSLTLGEAGVPDGAQLQLLVTKARASPAGTASSATTVSSGCVLAPSSSRGGRSKTSPSPRSSFKGGLCLRTLRGHSGNVESVAFSPDGWWVATASRDLTARLWHVSNEGMAIALRGHTDRVSSVVFSPDGNSILTASADATAKLWSLSGECTRTLDGHKYGVSAALFSQAGDMIATASHDCTARIWKIRTGQCVKTLEGHRSLVRSAQFSSDGSLVITASYDGTARLWNTASGVGDTIPSLQGHDGPICTAVFSPDDRLAMTSSVDCTARIWEMRQDEERDSRAGFGQVLGYTCLFSLEGHSAQVWSAEFSPDGTLAITASADYTARLWSVSKGWCLRVLGGHRDTVGVATFSPDSALVVTGSSDRTARLWLLNSGTASASCAGRDGLGDCCEHVHTFTGHTCNVLAAAFSPEGSVLATASADCSAKLWKFEDDLACYHRVTESDLTKSLVFGPGRPASPANLDGDDRELESVQLMLV